MTPALVATADPVPGFLFPRARAQTGLGADARAPRPRVTITVLTPPAPAPENPRVVEAAQESAHTWLDLPHAGRGIRDYLAIQNVLSPRAALVNDFA